MFLVVGARVVRQGSCAGSRRGECGGGAGCLPLGKAAMQSARGMPKRAREQLVRHLQDGSGGAESVRLAQKRVRTGAVLAQEAEPETLPLVLERVAGVRLEPLAAPDAVPQQRG